MNKQLKTKLLDIGGVALWVGVSASATYLIAELVKIPELAPLYGVLNIVLYALKATKK